MNPHLILPLALGVSVVAQATLNRQMGQQFGLAPAVTLNAVVFLVLSLGFFLLAKYTPTIVPEFLQARKSEAGFHWSYLIPGICGFLLVMGMPWSIQNIGPSTSFLLLIASQILASVALESYQAGTWPALWKLVGAVMVLIGGVLVVRG